MDIVNIEKIDLQEFHALISEWQILLSESNTDSYFLTYEWLSVWIKHLGTNSTPYILIAKGSKADDLLGAAPLVIEQTQNQIGLPIKKLGFMGNGSAEVDHLDFIIKKGFEDEVSTAFVDYLQKQKDLWDILFLDGLVSSSPVLNVLSNSYHPGQFFVQTEPCPYLPLPENWESLRQSLSKNMRYNLGRYKRKLEKAHSGSIEFKRVENSQELNKVLPELYSSHHLLQQAKNGENGIFEDSDIADFHTELSSKALISGQLRLYYLAIDDQVIASLYCYKYKDSVLFYQTAYKLEWQMYSPGRLLMAHAIETSIAEGAREFDFLRGAETYKSSWTPCFRTEIKLHIACSTRGYLTLLPQFIRKKIKGLLNTESGLAVVRLINPGLAQRISH